MGIIVISYCTIIVKNRGLVSIITPSYNASKYISVAIESVLSQTYQNWEMLITDDCSIDGSLEIAERYCRRDERIKLFQLKKNSGVATARNYSISQARGKYIAFLDSDDMWLPNKLEEQLILFDNEDTAIVYSDYEKISEQGIRNQRIVSAPSSTNYKHLLRGNVIGCLTALYDTEKAGKVYFENVNHEDYVLWLTILKKGFVARNTGKVHALYRVRTSSVSSNKWKALLWQWNIYINVEKVGYMRAAYYFLSYLIKAYKKRKI